MEINSTNILQGAEVLAGAAQETSLVQAATSTGNLQSYETAVEGAAALLSYIPGVSSATATKVTSAVNVAEQFAPVVQALLQAFKGLKL